VTDLTLHDAAYSLDGRHGVAAAANQFESGSNRGERISQFMRQHRQELVFPSIGFPQLPLRTGAFDRFPGARRGFLDEFNLLWSPRTRCTVAHAERPTSRPSLVNGAATNAPTPVAATADRSASGISGVVWMSATTPDRPSEVSGRPT
jgi:hypothetical protein